MSVQLLPSGRYRGQVYDNDIKKKISLTKVFKVDELMDKFGANDEGTFDSQEDAAKAAKAAKVEYDRRGVLITIAEWREMWLTKPIYSGHWSESTRIHRRQMTKEFVEECGNLYVCEFTVEVLAKYLRGGVKRGRRSGDRRGQVPFIRVMFNDAMTVEAGCLLDYNPAAHVKIKKSRGRADIQPLEPEQLFYLLRVSTELSPPLFTQVLAMGCVTAMRPSELVALEPEHVHRKRKRISVVQQFNAKTRSITLPKYGACEVGLTAPAETVFEQTMALRDPDSRWLFHNLDDGLWTPNARSFHWNKLRAALGLDKSMVFYVVTRHYFAWFSYVILKLDKRVVAAQLGHKDGGDLIERLYGHPDHQARLDELVAAYGNVTLGTPPPATIAPARPRLHVVRNDIESPPGVCHGFANGCVCARCSSPGDAPGERIRQPWEPLRRELVVT